MGNSICFRWKINIKNVYSGTYLTYDEDDKLSYAFSSEVNENSTWRIISSDNMVALTSLSSNVDVIWMDKNSSISIDFTIQPTNYTFSALEFWELCNVNYESVNESGYGDIFQISCTNADNMVISSKGIETYVHLEFEHKPTGVNKVILLIIGQIIPDDKYYIQNIENELYIALNSLSISDNGLKLTTSSRNSSQYWEVSYVGSGKYTIKNPLTKKYISSDGNGGVIQKTADYTEWFISISDDGNLIFTQTSDSDQAINSPVDTSNGYLLSFGSISSSTNYEWLIEQKDLEYDVVFLGIPDRNARGENFETALGYLENIGYTNNYAKLGDISNEFIKNLMPKSKIFMIRTHGASQEVSTSYGVIDSDFLSDVSLDEVELVIYGACNTGNILEDDEKNLVQMTQERGARTVIGFTGSVGANICEEWYNCFFEFFSQNICDDDPNNDDYVTLCAEVYQYIEWWGKNKGYGDNNLSPFRSPAISGELSFPTLN